MATKLTGDHLKFVEVSRADNYRETTYEVHRSDDVKTPLICIVTNGAFGGFMKPSMKIEDTNIKDEYYGYKTIVSKNPRFTKSVIAKTAEYLNETYPELQWGNEAGRLRVVKGDEIGSCKA